MSVTMNDEFFSKFTNQEIYFSELGKIKYRKEFLNSQVGQIPNPTSLQQIWGKFRESFGGSNPEQVRFRLIKLFQHGVDKNWIDINAFQPFTSALTVIDPRVASIHKLALGAGLSLPLLQSLPNSIGLKAYVKGEANAFYLNHIAKADAQHPLNKVKLSGVILSTVAIASAILGVLYYGSRLPYQNNTNIDSQIPEDICNGTLSHLFNRRTVTVNLPKGKIEAHCLGTTFTGGKIENLDIEGATFSGSIDAKGQPLNGRMESRYGMIGTGDWSKNWDEYKLTKGELVIDQKKYTILDEEKYRVASSEVVYSDNSLKAGEFLPQDQLAKSVIWNKGEVRWLQIIFPEDPETKERNLFMGSFVNGAINSNYSTLYIGNRAKITAQSWRNNFEPSGTQNISYYRN